MSFTTGNIAIDALVYSSWNAKANTPAALSFSFLETPPADATSDDRNGFTPMTSVQRQAVRDALDLWAAVANLTFTEVSANGNLQFGANSQVNSSAYAYLPEIGTTATQMYLASGPRYNSVFSAGSYGPTVMLHEIGHMLGLKHPGNYDSSGDAVEGPFLSSDVDTTDYTQMSYNKGTSTNQTNKYPTTPMLYDIQAVQYLYGANMSYHSGDDVYRFTTYDPARCIWDAGGVNTFDFSACTTRATIDLRAGGFSSTASGYRNVSIAYGVTISHAIAGNGGSVVYANDKGCTITGGTGADSVFVGAGDDIISTGEGTDNVSFGKTFASYTVVRKESGVTVVGEGLDRLDGVEYLIFSDRTVAVADLPLSAGPSGSALNDQFVLGPGNEIFDGGGGRDTVVISGSRANYTVLKVAGGFSITDKTGNGGTDQLINVEKLDFRDTDVSLELNGIGGQAYRLYQATFDRVPDLAGLGYWIDAMERGLSLQDAAGYFAQSAEFVATYGNVSNRQFATLMYEHTLHRAPDQAGLDWYTVQLDNGVSRSSVLADFSESGENQLRVIAAIENGIDYIPWIRA